MVSADESIEGALSVFHSRRLRNAGAQLYDSELCFDPTRGAPYDSHLVRLSAERRQHLPEVGTSESSRMTPELSPVIAAGLELVDHSTCEARQPESSEFEEALTS